MRCQHLESLGELKKAKAYECEECVKTGGQWVHLRTCQSCGMTLCCDSSPGKHMTNHYQAYNHPVASSAEPGESWSWCYEHQMIKKQKM